MARERQVYPTDRVPHLWAHQSQQAARNALGNLYFQGPTIYSYGSHFPIARIVEREGKGRIVLFNIGTYSLTTSRQQSRVRQAIPSYMRVIHVPEVIPYGEAHEANVRHLTELALDCLAKAHRARQESSKGWHLSTAQDAADDARDLARYFDLPTPDLPAMDAEGAAHAARLIANAKAEEERKRRDAEEKRRAELAEEMAAWQAGDYVANTWAFPDTLLRVNPADSAEVQTSKGVVFPVEHARRVWPILARLYASGGTYQRNGHSIHLGTYVLDSVDGQGTIRAGCHTITRAEVERFAKVLSLV
jgi:hypothetical protein